MDRLEECQHHALEVQVQSALQDDNLSWNCARLHERGDFRDIAEPSEAASRDVRFARDKTPYKTHQGAIVGPFYVQVSAEGLLAAGGQYRWLPDQLARFRAAVDDDRRGRDLEARIATVTATDVEGTPPTMAGECLATRPRRVPADHPRLELLRRRGLYAHRGWEPDDSLHEAATAHRVAAVWRATRPLTEWLDDHVGPPEHAR